MVGSRAGKRVCACVRSCLYACVREYVCADLPVVDSKSNVVPVTSLVNVLVLSANDNIFFLQM